MATKTAAGLVEFCKQCLNAKLGYVFGAFGRVCTTSLLDQCARNNPSPNLAGGPMRKLGEKWLGKRVVDCSGMIKYYLMTDKFGQDPKYTLALDTCININKAVKSGNINTLPETPGTLVYMPGHVGVYIGNGQVIESKGTAYGVCQTALKGRGWTKWFQIKEIDYTQSTSFVPLSLDTSEYTFKKLNQVYTLLAKGTEHPTVTSNNPKVCKVAYLKKDSRGYLFNLTSMGVGVATITAKTSKKTISIRVSCGCDIDTTNYTCKSGDTYTFLVKCIEKPNITIDDVNVAEVTYKGSDSRGHLFQMKAKKPGKTVIRSTLGTMSDRMNVTVNSK